MLADFSSSTDTFDDVNVSSGNTLLLYDVSLAGPLICPLDYVIVIL